MPTFRGCDSVKHVALSVLLLIVDVCRAQNGPRGNACLSHDLQDFFQGVCAHPVTYNLHEREDSQASDDLSSMHTPRHAAAGELLMLACRCFSQNQAIAWSPFEYLCAGQTPVREMLLSKLKVQLATNASDLPSAE